MKSVLLGGLKVFLVNDGGSPLSAPGGRAEFYVAGTSTPEPVYSDIDLTEATALGPIVYTDELGYLPPIWLKTDRLYKVQIKQKLPGSLDVWSLLWEVDNVGYIDPHSSEDTGEQPITVSTIAALKAVDHSEHGAVLVLGYYNEGDWGEPALFVYDENSTASVDGGSVIKPNDIPAGSSGRWLQMLSGDIVDVRRFGAIPDNGTDVTTNVQSAATYATNNSTRTRPLTVGFLAPGRYLFSGGFNFTVYSFTDLSDSSVHPLNWLIEKDVVFKGGGSSTFTLSTYTDCRTVETLVEDASALNVPSGGPIVVDPVWWGTLACTLDSNFVRCSSLTTNDKSFTACSVESTGKLGGNVHLTYMDFEQSWFDDSYDFSDLTISNVGICLHDCLTPNDYIGIINALIDNGSISEPAYGNLNSCFISNVELKDGFVIENALFSNVTLQGDGTIINCKGTVTKDSSAIDILTIRGSDITFKPNAYNDFDHVGILEVSDSTISGILSSTNVLTNQLIAHDSTIGVTTKINGPIDLDGCSITYDVEQKAVESSGTYYLNGKITGCVLTASHVLLTDDTGTDTVVNIVWKDNVSSAATAIDVSGIASHVKTSASYHGYVNEGNTGTFLPSAISKSVTISDFGIDEVSDIDAMAPGTKAYVARKVVSLPTDIHYGAVYVELDESYTLFSIGTNETFVVDISVDLVSENSGHGADEPEYMDIIVPINRIIQSNTSTVSIASLKGYVSQYIYNSFIGTIDSARAYVNIRRNR